MTRQTKTPRQRAEEAVGVARRKHDQIKKKRDQLRTQLATAETDLTEAEGRLDYAMRDPALPPTTSTSQSTTSNQSGDTA